MARKLTGAVIEHQGRDGRTYRSLRFTALGRRHFVSLGPVSTAEAQRELRHVLADVERGTWRPPEKSTAAPERIPTFHEFAAQWWVRHERQLAPNTQADYKWRLAHLLPFFAAVPLDRITFDLVERYIAMKLSEREPLSARSINMTLTLMAAILEGAVERELIARNPAKGKSRRVREREPRRSYLETAEQIAALLRAGGELDGRARADRRHISRRAILATFVFAGLRLGELCGLRWRDVDLATGWLQVADSKTDAGRRRVKLRGALREELLSIRASVLAEADRLHPKSRECVRLRARLNPESFVFATRTGGRPSSENIRDRVVAPAIRRASEHLVAAGSPPMPQGLSPHSLRRTFASVLYALGEDPGVVMDEMGHTDPALALRVYRQTMRRGDEEKAALRALVEGGSLLADRGSEQTADIGILAPDALDRG